MPIVFTALLSALLTRLQISADSWLGLTAPPRADRWHTVPTPSSGGLAIFLSCAAAYWLACPGRYPRIALAVAALWIFGFLDDRLRVRPHVVAGDRNLRRRQCWIQGDGQRRDADASGENNQQGADCCEYRPADKEINHENAPFNWRRPVAG